MSKQPVIIVIPVYTPTLKPFEEAALANNLRVFSTHPAVFLRPEGVDISAFASRYPQVGEVAVSTQWLGTERGIAGYNDMMMSEKFYQLFADYEFMLICHVDAWVFRDDLKQWMARGFDHVAAPWPTRPRYTRFPLKQYLQLKVWLKPRRKVLHCQMFGRIGNGGFSLRKVDTFARLSRKYADEAAYYLAQDHPLYNEDLFWALVPEELSVPAVAEALTFSFDLKPELSYQLNHNTLPMACHGFNKPPRVAFWRQFISCI